jgi:hypothetical protein
MRIVMNKSYTLEEAEELLYLLKWEQVRFYDALERGSEFEELKEIYLNIKAIKERLNHCDPEIKYWFGINVQ